MEACLLKYWNSFFSFRVFDKRMASEVCVCVNCACLCVRVCVNGVCLCVRVCACVWDYLLCMCVCVSGVHVHVPVCVCVCVWFDLFIFKCNIHNRNTVYHILTLKYKAVTKCKHFHYGLFACCVHLCVCVCVCEVNPVYLIMYHQVVLATVSILPLISVGNAQMTPPLLLVQGENSGLVKKYSPHHLQNSTDNDIKANVTCAVYNYNGQGQYIAASYWCVHARVCLCVAQVVKWWAFNLEDFCHIASVSVISYEHC